MADGKCRDQYQYLFPVAGQVNSRQSQNEQPMIFGFPCNDMMPAQIKIKTQILHGTVYNWLFVLVLPFKYL